MLSIALSMQVVGSFPTMFPCMWLSETTDPPYWKTPVDPLSPLWETLFLAVKVINPTRSVRFIA